MRALRPVLILLTAAVMLPALAQPVSAETGPQIVAAAATPNPDADPLTGKTPDKTSVLDYVNSGYQFMAILGGMLAIAMLIYAGYRYMTSYGDPEKISDAKDVVEKALIGLALLILAALILNTINPRTSQQPCKPGQPGCGSVDFSQPKG